MTAPIYPELRITALVENAEAVAHNAEDAISYEIQRRVGFRDLTQEDLTLDDECAIDIGDSVFANAVEKVLMAICRGMRAIQNTLWEIVAAFTDRMTEFFETFIGSLIAVVENVVNTVTTVLSNAVVSVVDRLQEVVGAIVDTLQSIVGAITDKLRDVLNVIEDVVGAIFNKIGEVVSAILAKIRDGFEALLGAASNVISAIGAKVSDIIQFLIDGFLALVARIGAPITASVEPLVGAAESGLARVRLVIESIPDALREIFDKAQTFVGEAVGAHLATMGTILVSQVEAFFEKLIEEREVSPGKILRDFLGGLGLPIEVVERFASSADSAQPKTPALFALGAVAIIPLIIGPLVSAVFSPVTDELRQEVAQRVTPTLIPPADSIDAFLRGHWDENRLTKELGEAGFSQERQDTLLLTARRVLDVGELLRWWLRGIISETELTNLAKAHHIDTVDMGRLKQAAFFIPPVQDLISMAVREVFSPEIRARFGQDEGFPDEFATFGAQQGVSEFWARAYWAAHWRLPSAGQGFEMLHRKVIDGETLDLLLRAQDVMPFWREKLTAIAYHPLTRVDVRRMHKLGVLSEDDVQERYENLGFNTNDARLMTQFTLAYNAEAPAEDPVELEGLTRATVLGMFDDGIVTRNQAQEVMGALGYTDDAAELFLLQRELEIERATRREEIALVLDQVASGTINFEQGQDQLGGLGLEAAELAKATTSLLRERARQTTIPPRGDLDKMLKARLIDSAQYVEALNRRGFSRFWADNYLALIQAGQQG